MPIYEYRCKKCGVFEAMQKITAASLKKCPTCKGKVEKLVSRSSFVLKGSGWYATDYAKKGTSESAADAKPASAPDQPANGAASSDAPSAAPKSEAKPNTGKKAAAKPAG
ncbi:MAG: FmdB family zinc ribbon protein [Candidatus Binataceae bacterium]